MKKVLIALDYDPTAKKVAEVGFEFAKAMGAEVVLLHVMVDPLYYSSIDNFPIAGYTGTLITPLQIVDTDMTKKQSGLFLDKIKLHLGDDAIQTLVKEGDFAEVILKTATDSHADLIVMGSHSRRWLEEILMGSVTEQVLHHTSIPLFIIPTHGTKK